MTGGAGARPVFIFMQILNYLIRSVTRLPFLHSPAGRAGPGPTGSSRGDPSLHNLNIYWLQSFREKIPHHRGRPSIFHTKYFHVYNIPTSESGWKQMTPCNDSSNRKLSSRCCGGDVQHCNILTSNAEVQQHSKDHLAFIKRSFMA